MAPSTRRFGRYANWCGYSELGNGDLRKFETKHSNTFIITEVKATGTTADTTIHYLKQVENVCERSPVENFGEDARELRRTSPQKAPCDLVRSSCLPNAKAT